MTTATKTGLALSALLVAAASISYYMAREGDAETYQRAAAEIRQIRQLATEWSVETARVRSNPLGDYDALAAFIPEVARLKKGLLEAVRATPTMPERLANDTYAFASALDAKEERIERFKTANSVIRNSARYLPNAAASIARTASDAGLAGDVTELADGLGRYAASPSDEAKGRLKAIHERLEERLAALPGDDAGTLSNYLAHAEILLERQAPTERIFRQATSGDVSDLAGDLAAEFDIQGKTLERQAELYMMGVWASVVALSLVWVFVFVARSHPAPSQEAQPPAAAEAVEAAEAALAVAGAGSEAATNGSTVHHDPPDTTHKLLMSQQILTEVVGAGIAQAVRDLTVGFDDATARRAEDIAVLAERFATTNAARTDRYDLVDLTDCAEAALDVVAAGDGARVVAEFDDAPPVFASRAELGLMLEQVIDNALHAIRDKGLDADEGEICVKTARDGVDASVTVIDNGIGISPEDRMRMFEPFAGTREDRPGVGLAITQHIVHKYGGRIAVGSQPGGGTVLRISLPGMSE
ncbi:MAG: ATP-binding protein [Gammaproteobacteria bacterium]|nr:ATP-binding protein [Gammaproteobacteria bacterium]MDE0441103.1 ATP-binding protein [Gammaproteobacteria bacterium]